MLWMDTYSLFVCSYSQPTQSHVDVARELPLKNNLFRVSFILREDTHPLEPGMCSHFIHMKGPYVVTKPC